MPTVVLGDIGKCGLDLLICGYNPGARSATAGHYFSNRGNRFWQILAKAGLTPSKLEPRLDYTLPKYGIGLTDLLKHSIHGQCPGPTEGDRDRLRKLILDWRPVVVAFLGKKPACGFLKARKLGWGHLGMHVGPTELFMVPDPSGGNGHFDRLQVHWCNLADRIRSSRG
jgi:double-stranded uracil-DNA glycosylase